MSDVREMMIDSIDRLMEDVLTTDERTKADGGGMSEAVWAKLVEQGMTALGDVGNDVTYADALAIVRRAAYHAAPVPLAETILARRLLSRAGIAVPEGALSVVTPNKGGAAMVPWGRFVSHLVVVDDAGIRLVDHGSAVTHKGQNQAGEPRDGIDLAKARVVAEARGQGLAAEAMAEGALIRSVQLSGGLERALAHCLTWVNERVQFGKPIARFQAVQHQMAILASEVAAAKAATDLAIERAEPKADRFAVAVAKSRAGEAAGKAANIAHAAFGAMGFTREHQLHYTTRRLWAWRDEYGTEQQWQAELGRIVAAQGGDRLWATLTAHG